MVVDELSAGLPSIFGARMGGKGKKNPAAAEAATGKTPKREKPKMFIANRYSKRDLNPHSHYWPREFKSLVSTIPPFEPDERP